MKPELMNNGINELSDNISDEFITSDDPVFNNTGHLYKGTIGDLHKELAPPSAEESSKIREEISTSALKKDDITSKISDAISKLKKTEDTPVSPLDKLKLFIEVGALTSEFEMFGTKWKIKTLDQADKIAMYDEAESMAASTGRIPALSLLNVVYALEAVGGVSIYKTFQEDINLDMFKGNKHAYVVAVRAALKQFMLAYPQRMIEALNNKVQELEDEQIKALSELKNS